MKAGENYYHGGLIRHDFTPKPSYFVLKELLKRLGALACPLTAETSSLMFKGFYGEYELIASAGDRTVTTTFHLDKQHKNELDIVIP